MYTARYLGFMLGILLLGFGAGLLVGLSRPIPTDEKNESELTTLRLARQGWQAEKEQLQTEIAEAKKAIPIPTGTPQDWQKENQISQLKAEKDRLQSALDLEKKRHPSEPTNSLLAEQLLEQKNLNQQLKQERDALYKQLKDSKTANKTEVVEPTPKPIPTGPAQHPVENRPRTVLAGMVTLVDPSGAMMISLGKNEGLKKGDRLELIRSGPERKILGTIVVIETWANEAGCIPVKPLIMATEVGDKVEAMLEGQEIPSKAVR